ncbi:hypothetical protein LCGC14_2395660, partial [marine sediment metagenome]
MADELDKYLTSISGLYGFEVGDNGISESFGEYVQAFVDSSGKPSRAVSFSFEAMKMAWIALPPDIRVQAISMLRDAANEALEQFGDQIGDVPIFGWIVDFALELFRVIGEVRRGVKENNEAFSKQERNRMLDRTFRGASNPTTWIYTTEPIVNYMSFGGGLGHNRWRLKPSVNPTVAAGDIFGLNIYPIVGNCHPGKPYKAPSGFDGDWKAKDSTSKCKAFASFSALFYPYWSPDHTTAPIRYYGSDIWPEDVGFRDEGVDPNLILIGRQVMLLSDPVTNLQARGSWLETVRYNFIVTVLEELQWAVDSKYNEKYDTGRDHPVKLYNDANGLILPYDEGGLGLDTFLTGGNEQQAITVAKYNCVIGMTRAFFTARAAFL